ncbi:MAG: DUF2490 domain-containing protein [Cytophagales bacterium]
MKYYKLIVTIVLLIAAFTIATAQDKVNRQSLIWARYYLKLKLNDKYTIRYEIEERLFFKNQRQHQFMTRAFADRYLGKGWNTAIGIAYFSHSRPSDPTVLEYRNWSEIRPVLEIGKRHILSDKFKIDHRFWQEFRFYEQENKSISYRNLRTRYRLEFRFQLNTQLTLRLLDEIHFNPEENDGRTFFDQNRIGIGAQYFPKPHLGFELAYINWFQQISKLPEFYQRDIMRITIFLDIRTGKRAVN